MARRCCLASAESFCCTIRSRDIDSLSCTLSFDCRGLIRLVRDESCGDLLTTIDDGGAIRAII